ncbi:Uncharacterised protein [uncultured archaeon]|nr:Uncharacterised protein [uncultured archaeon]
MRKRGIVMDYLPWIIIALVVLTILVIGIALSKDRGIAAIDMIKNLFKSGGH